ncbi:hypothetical protein GV819_11635 [Pseudomonas sp. Fl5BN2]|uniref:hypothetical protein n=1 Tax=unclassified Pseudomonas TaxID=196821 RepID=UPI001377569F|nr:MULTISPECIES: hypothetical protein [unclassified Pseudomonas]NBF02939.1 hypothetical protein [Pseudomonas sp. Fl5BN2]NBF11719.1 hypothetical protein [Pseudomonas sp. Fl4BN1]
MYFKPFSSLQRALRAVLVIGLSTCARLLTRMSIRLYVRGLLSAVEVRFLLEFSAVITRTSLRLAIA